MKDLIRRSDAIKAFCMDCKGQSEPCEHSGTCKTLKVLRSRKKIPTVEPKQGEWIGEGDGYADGGIVYDTWYCSNCDHCEEGEELALPNYCPNCGADMRKGADDDTD